MPKVFTRHRGKIALKCVVELGIHSARLGDSDVASNGELVAVSWKRGSNHAGETQAVVVSRGKARFEDSFQLPCTFYKDAKTRALDAKVLQLHLVQKQNNKKKHRVMGLCKINLADLANTTSAVTRVYTLENSAYAADATLKITLQVLEAAEGEPTRAVARSSVSASRRTEIRAAIERHERTSGSSDDGGEGGGGRATLHVGGQRRRRRRRRRRSLRGDDAAAGAGTQESWSGSGGGAEAAARRRTGTATSGSHNAPSDLDDSLHDPFTETNTISYVSLGTELSECSDALSDEEAFTPYVEAVGAVAASGAGGKPPLPASGDMTDREARRAATRQRRLGLAADGVGSMGRSSRVQARPDTTRTRPVLGRSASVAVFSDGATDASWRTESIQRRRHSRQYGSTGPAAGQRLLSGDGGDANHGRGSGGSRRHRHRRGKGKERPHSHRLNVDEIFASEPTSATDAALHVNDGAAARSLSLRLKARSAERGGGGRRTSRGSVQGLFSTEVGGGGDDEGGSSGSSATSTTVGRMTTPCASLSASGSHSIDDEEVTVVCNGRALEVLLEHVTAAVGDAQATVPGAAGLVLGCLARWRFFDAGRDLFTTEIAEDLSDRLLFAVEDAAGGDLSTCLAWYRTVTALLVGVQAMIANAYGDRKTPPTAAAFVSDLSEARATSWAVLVGAVVPARERIVAAVFEGTDAFGGGGSSGGGGGGNDHGNGNEDHDDHDGVLTPLGICEGELAAAKAALERAPGGSDLLLPLFVAVFEAVNGHLVNALLDGRHGLKVGNALKMKMALSTVEAWVVEAGLDDPPSHSIRAALWIAQVCNMAMIPKDILRDPAERAAVCPSVSLPRICRLLENHEADDFDPAPVDDGLLNALSAECAQAFGLNPAVEVKIGAPAPPPLPPLSSAIDGQAVALPGSLRADLGF